KNHDVKPRSSTRPCGPVRRTVARYYLATGRRQGHARQSRLAVALERKNNETVELLRKAGAKE
ncbi:MAG: hypothetical protein NTU94_15675, partial [Planctomycetota bacterium]|nr:hypothetical protein [Planctomycetota bacterium]